MFEIIREERMGLTTWDVWSKEGWSTDGWSRTVDQWTTDQADGSSTVRIGFEVRITFP